MYKLNNWLIHLDHPLVTDLLKNEEKRIGYHDHLVILMLCENAGKIKTKEDLLNRAWPGKHVSEGSLTQSISAIRTLIEDDGKQQKYLKTVAKVGYKLESEAVSWLEESDSQLDSQDHSLTGDPSGKAGSFEDSTDKNTQHTCGRNQIYIALGLVFIVIAALFPLVFATKEPNLTSWLPLTKMFSSEALTVYSDNEEEAKVVAKGVTPLVSEEVKQGRLSRLILAHSQESLSIVILKPLAPPVNLVVLFESPQSTDDLVGMVNAELSRYVY
ncbi:transcriptional regulator [Vibrio chagasii]|uniref:Transcriptional regulator n=2 Tax=Vibrio chagasii TaxID=170679 RepID=A0A2S7VHH1_9VIBR|nr:winged helix-turn-helix domain-containing protein [Vibrio chagasii]PQJ61040.1 transcriptional regulator [Vibrio chagasii]